MSDFTEVINFLSHNFSAQNLFYIGLVIVPMFIFMKWGLTPRNFIEFIDFVYERKLKKLDHDLAYFSENDVQKKIFERDRIFLINAHHTGINKREFQEIILKTISSNGMLGVDAYKKVAGYLHKKDDHIYIRRNVNFWFNWLFTRIYSCFLSLYALLFLMLTITNFQNQNYGKAFVAILLMMLIITVITILITSVLGFKEINKLNSLLEAEQKSICKNDSSDAEPSSIATSTIA
jgi:hypothetical protein